LLKVVTITLFLTLIAITKGLKGVLLASKPAEETMGAQKARVGSDRQLDQLTSQDRTINGNCLPFSCQPAEPYIY